MLDALKLVDCPVIEVHISNPNAREPWRHTSVVAPVATGSILGLGIHGSEMAVEAIARAYFALDARPFDLGDGGYDVRRKPLQDKMGRTHSVATQVHLDARINRILWQMREAELIQALDRVRAVRFPRRVFLDFAAGKGPNAGPI